MATDDDWLNRIKALNDQFIALTGREGYNWTARPTPTTWKIAFGDGTVKTSPREGHDYMATLVWLAKNKPSDLPYPLDQPLPPEWDLRNKEAR